MNTLGILPSYLHTDQGTTLLQRKTYLERIVTRTHFFKGLKEFGNFNRCKTDSELVEEIY